MRIASRQIVGVAVLALSLMTCTAQAQSIKTFAGNPVIQRDGTDNGYATHYLLDTTRPFTATGKVTHWEIWADATNPVQLVIFRQIAGSFVEVGRSELVTPKPGYNLFALAPKNQMQVQAGDFVGAYLPVSASIVYTGWNGPFCSGTGNLGHAVLFTVPGNDVFSFSCDRTYSLRAFWNGPDQ